MLGAPDRARGVEGQDLADDEPVEEHPERREMLLDARGRERPGKLLDVGRDHHRLDLVEGEAPVLTPLSEAPDGCEVGEAGVRVPDVGGEELPEAPLRRARKGRRAPASPRGARAGRGRAGRFDWD